MESVNVLDGQKSGSGSFFGALEKEGGLSQPGNPSKVFSYFFPLFLRSWNIEKKKQFRTLKVLKVE